jgi:hypothetical protein
MTEIEIEGVGTYRLPNQWQGQRLKRLRGDDRHTAVLAIGCGMTVRQFNKLPADKQHEVHRAYLALMSSSNMDSLVREPAETRLIPRGHLSLEQKLAVGRWLLHNKASLPHGHFGPWVARQEGLSQAVAHQCMAMAKVNEGEKRAA